MDIEKEAHWLGLRKSLLPKGYKRLEIGRGIGADCLGTEEDIVFSYSKMSRWSGKWPKASTRWARE
jgi:hypothetical protein